MPDNTALTDLEVRAFAVASLIGLTPGANFFTRFTSISKSRAKELESLELTDADRVRIMEEVMRA